MNWKLWKPFHAELLRFRHCNMFLQGCTRGIPRASQFTKNNLKNEHKMFSNKKDKKNETLTRVVIGTKFAGWWLHKRGGLVDWSIRRVIRVLQARRSIFVKVEMKLPSDKDHKYWDVLRATIKDNALRRWLQSILESCKVGPSKLETPEKLANLKHVPTMYECLCQPYNKEQSRLCLTGKVGRSSYLTPSRVSTPYLPISKPLKWHFLAFLAIKWLLG